MRIILQFLLLALIAMSGSSYAKTTSDSSCQKIFNHFSKDDQYVYYIGGRLFSADPQSFEVIDESYYAKDKQFVYFKEIRIADADPETFEVIKNDNFNALAKDQNRVYRNETVVESANPQYFENIEGNYYKDNKSIFYDGVQFENVDINTFIIYNYGFSRDDRQLYAIAGINLTHTGGIPVFTPYIFEDLRIEQPENLIFLEGHYFKDQQNFYFFRDKFYPLNMLNPNNFHYIAKGYFHDQNKVYYNSEFSSKLIPLDADLATFKQIEIDGILIFRDKNGCFSKDEKVDCEVLIKKQKEIVNSPFIRWQLQQTHPDKPAPRIDANCGKASENITADNYHQVSRWSKDYFISKDRVYYENKIIEKADPATFEYVGTIDLDRNPQKYFRDKNHVYLNNNILKDIDAESFVLLSDLRAKDKNKIYTWRELGELQEE